MEVLKNKNKQENKTNKVAGHLAVRVPKSMCCASCNILATLARCRRPEQVLGGFAAETDDLRQNAAAKLQTKGIDLIVANDVSAPDVGFDHETNAVTVLDATGGVLEVPLAEKREVARVVLDAALDCLRMNRSMNGDEK